MIFDLRFGQSGSFDNRPHNGLGAPIKLVGHGKFHQFAGNPCLRMESHRCVGILEISDNAETFEFIRLGFNPMFGKFPTFLPEFVNRNIVFILAFCTIFFFDLPFDRQPMAIPAGYIIGIIAPHLERTDDCIL